jgi:protein-tyrosine phosphatase
MIITGIAHAYHSSMSLPRSMRSQKNLLDQTTAIAPGQRTSMQKHDGDQYVDYPGEQAVVTPLHPDTLYNFGPASNRDSTVYTSQRPGGDPQPGSKIDTTAEVREWKEFMSHPERNIKNVIVLQEEDQLAEYDGPGLIQAYNDCGLTVHHIPCSIDKSFSKIMTVLDDIEEKKERVVVHCSHGKERGGRIAAAWLVHKYGLSPEEATEESLAAARAHGVERLGAPNKLSRWMADA